MGKAFREKLKPVIVAAAVSEGVESTEVGYRALSGLAVASAGCAVLSIAAFFDWGLAVFPIAALVLGWWALKQIDRNPMEMSGRRLALGAMGAACVFWAGGTAWIVYDRNYNIPSGYEFTTFKVLQPDVNRLEMFASEEAKMLADRPVFIRGFMAPGKQQAGIKEFVLMDEPNSCKYCQPQPSPSRLIRVKLTGGMKTGYTAREIGVGGKLIVHATPTSETGGLVYEIEADCLR
jgi:hypothetical protein